MSMRNSAPLVAAAALALGGFNLGCDSGNQGGTGGTSGTGASGPSGGGGGGGAGATGTGGAGTGAGGGAGLAGAGNLGKSNVSRCQCSIGAPSCSPNTIGSVPPGNGNVTGPHPNSGIGVAG